MKFGIASLSLFAHQSVVFANTGGLRHRHIQTTNDEASHCGCQDCDDSIWNLNVYDYNGDYTCGARIEWVRDTLGQTEEDACIAVAANEFPTECGKACNPFRCDGRQNPYSVANDPPVVSGDLAFDADLYCYPSYNARQTYTNVWSNNFIMQTKETQDPLARCDPGANLFDKNAASFDANTQELTLTFEKEPGEGVWRGSEVRLVLPVGEAPFSYGTYEWSVKSIEIIDSFTNTVVSKTLPPRIVLGLFTWDPSENFAIRENRNHEVDIEISNFGEIGGPDVNFLVQPPGKPQQGKFYSGGATGVYDQGGHTYKFDWNPNNITWYTDAAGGLSHVYSADIVLDYASPAWLQCMPADVEIRMNLWSLDGANPQLNLANHQKIQVVIDNFVYTPSGETHVPDGGSCVKHCQCSASSKCDAGVCKASTTVDSAPTASPVTGNGASTEMPTATKTESRQCSAHPECAARNLSGDCCPTIDNVFLYCCSDQPAGVVSPPPPSSSRACSAHPECKHLAGNCCPTNDDKMLYCCGGN